MLDTIYIGTSSLLGHAKGLRVVGNNLANVNTPGFKSSQLQFGNVFEQNSNSTTLGQSGSSGLGNGVSVIGTTVNFKAGIAKATEVPSNISIDGDGFFAVKRDDKIFFTRDGSFTLDEETNILHNKQTKDRLQSFVNGQLSDIDFDNFNTSPPKASSTIKFSGTLPNSPINTQTLLDEMTVVDVNGNTHKFKLTFVLIAAGEVEIKISALPSTDQETLGKLSFGAGSVLGDGQLKYIYRPKDASDLPLTFDFSAITQSTNLPGKVQASPDGYVAGTRSGYSIGTDGIIKFTYSNQQTVNGPRIAIANFNSSDDLNAMSNGLFELKAGSTAQFGNASENGFGKIKAGTIEASNVDLAEEFGNLILMQRGYQAASHVISTANDMIQGLFDMKGNR